jgi:hypothetical protein
VENTQLKYTLAGSTLALVFIATPLVAQSNLRVQNNLRVQSNERTAPGTVEYRLSGTARSCDATYRNAQGVTEQQTIAVPNHYRWEGAHQGDFLYLSCQIAQGEDGGTLRLEILTDGIVRESDEVVGFPQIAQVTGLYTPLPSGSDGVVVSTSPPTR